jgi:ubiquitin carboxyl-terminal hydrolase 8
MDKDLEEVEYGISKFNNSSGVTCYINSILAILQQTPIFADYILTANYKDKIKNTDSILFQLYNIINLSHTYDNYNINPDTFRKVVSLKNEMWGYQQHQDSQEFLSFLLNSIEEELAEKVQFIPGRINNNHGFENNLQNNLINIMANNCWQKYIKNEFSIIKNLFGGMSHVVITCDYCNNKSHNFDFFQILQLSINNKSNNTLYECLDEFIKEEKVDKDNMIKCDFCGHYNQSSKQTKLWKTPKILIIQLKRFQSNNYGIITQKISKMIEYPLNLNIDKYIDDNINKEKTTYNLFAVNNHHNIGNTNSINFGHYTSNVINRFNNKWYKFDDANELKEIYEIISKNAYNLFYIRDD